MSINIVSSLFLLLCTFSISAIEPTREKMLENLDIIKNSFETYYAPSDWKKQYADWDLDEKIAEAKIAVLDAEQMTVKDYQRILKQFFLSTKDYHVGISFYSTEEAFLPFRIHGAEGKYYIAWVYHPVFSGLKDPLGVGDEVVLFDGIPVHESVQNLRQSDFGIPGMQTDQALAECALTMRLGEDGYKVPKGPVTLTVRHAGTKNVTTYRLNWYYNPENVTSPFDPLAAASQAKVLIKSGGRYSLAGSNLYPLGEHPFFAKEMVSPKYKMYQKAFKRQMKKLAVAGQEEAEDSFIGSRKSYIPDLGEKIWTSGPGNPFEAYIYLSPEGRQIGYVRIPHYMGSNYSASKFADIISKFEMDTDAVVIDQINNPGGNVFYMYALASMLSPNPLEVARHEMAITQEDVYFAIQGEEELSDVRDDEEACAAIGSSLWGYPVDLTLSQQMLEYFQFIIDEWEAGHVVTQPSYLFGVRHLALHPRVQYSKPLVVLTNSLDFSCADFFPAILQDNGRAVIVGTRTAGAGGYVLSGEYPNIFGVQEYTFTGSIARRRSDEPIENLGITPDVEADLTPYDLEFNYQHYIEKIHQAVRDICP